MTEAVAEPESGTVTVAVATVLLPSLPLPLIMSLPPTLNLPSADLILSLMLILSLPSLTQPRFQLW